MYYEKPLKLSSVSHGEGNGNPLQCLAWRILWTEEPGGLLSIGSHRVGHDWSDYAAAAGKSFASSPSVPHSSFPMLSLSESFLLRHCLYFLATVSSSLLKIWIYFSRGEECTIREIIIHLPFLYIETRVLYLSRTTLLHRDSESLSAGEGSDFEDSLRRNGKKRAAKRPLKPTPVSQFCFWTWSGKQRKKT